MVSTLEKAVIKRLLAGVTNFARVLTLKYVGQGVLSEYQALNAGDCPSISFRVLS